MSETITYAFRLSPGTDLKESIQQFVIAKNIVAGWIVTCVGSLTEFNLRFADQQNGTTGAGHFEIVSLVGTLSINGSHLHMSVSDSDGKTIGGHLLDGCKVYTTAEIIVASTKKFVFTRETDEITGYKELHIV